MRAVALAALATLLAGCEAPIPPTTERIIRIQIEGCEDATPLPATPTPAPSAPATVIAAAPTTSAPTAPPPTETPAILATPLPRATERTAEALADEYRLKRDAFLGVLADQRLAPADVPTAFDSFQRALDRERARNFDEALRHVEVALLEVKSVKIGEPFIQKKFARVDSRLQESRAKLPPRDQRLADEGLQKAQGHFLKLEYKKANNALFDVEQILDRQKSKPR